ncbi:IS630 family transposase [Dactylosporangium sp. CA-092794]|uniref:IS630 family transposase n=1 Tax=Dactylosporangium sp. CA-092794 TaxID=3239929 RepID=UPI003D90A43D
MAAGGVAGGKTVAAQRDAWICFEDEAGQTLRPPKARTWGRRGHTPVIPVSGKGSGRVSIAGLACYQRGRCSRFIYRTIVHRNRKGERRSFSERDYIGLLDAAHQQLNAPIVVIWDNLNTHISAAMRELIAARDWLHVIRLPAYTPDLNPVEAVWSHLKRSIGNLAVNGVDHLQAIIKNRLKSIQYRTDLLDSFLTHTGLTLEPNTT